VGLDGSEGSFKALREALDLAKLSGAELHTISVEEMPRAPEVVGEYLEEKEAANGFYREAIARAKSMALEAGLTVHCHVRQGHEVKTIVEFTKDGGFDLLVVGFMGHSALYDRIMGSTCQALVRLAPCSALVVK